MKYPRLDIDLFDKNGLLSEFYANRFSKHLVLHDAHIKHPHSHEFYITLYISKGFGTHTIDFVDYPISPNSIFFLQPDQLHHWNFKQETEGWIFFHSEQFYTHTNPEKNIRDWPFFQTSKSNPHIHVSYKEGEKLETYFEAIFREYELSDRYTLSKLSALQQIIYTDVSRLYKTDQLKTQPHDSRSKQLVQQFLNHLSTENIPKQNARYYADKLAISSKHLHRVCQEITGKNPTQLIHKELIFRGKKALIIQDLNLSQIATQLGFESYPYFTRFFKKEVGVSPTVFRTRNT